MRIRRLLLLSSVLIGIFAVTDRPNAQGPQAAFHGGMTGGIVRDATRVGSVIYAVGTWINSSAGGRIDGALWAADGDNPPIRTALPDICSSNCGSQNLQAGEAITPDAAYLASHVRTGGTAANAVTAVRVTRSPLTNLNLTPTVTSNPKLARTISDDGSILYGSASMLLPGTTTFRARVVRFDVNAGTTTVVYPQPAQDSSGFNISQSMVQRGASSDGAVAVGQTFTDIPVVDTQAFLYVHDVGAANIPRLPGGTYNSAIALSGKGIRDGNTVDVAIALVGNSTEFPSEAYTYNPATNTITELGVPNAGGSLRGPGGITDDAAVVAVTSSFPCQQPCVADTYAYFHNSHGWFHLTSALGAAGVDLSGWRNLQAFGMSGDGTLVWGTGVHDGTQEGFVAEFAPGYLKNFDPQPSPPANTSIVGAWSEDDIGEEDHFIVFMADGTYYQVEDENGGFERGFYTYDGSVLTITTVLDTNGSSGFSDLNGMPLSISVNGDTLDSMHRIVGAPGSIAGAWIAGNPSAADNSFVLVLTANTYGQAFDFDDDYSETGTYTWNPVTHQADLTPTGGVADVGNFFIPSPDGLTAHAIGDDGDEYDFTRVIDPAIVPAIANTPLAANGVVGQAFNYSVTATNVASFSTTGLPAGLSIDSGTGEISGTPTVGGQFAVTIAATNTMGVSDIETLTLTIAIPTPVGQNVVVEPQVPAGQGPVTLSFGEITAAGTTTVTILDLDESGVPPPGNVQVGGVVYDVTTTATYQGLITLCFSYAGIDFGGATPQLFHYENTVWVDITTSVDPGTQTICGATTTLSPFAVLVSNVVRTGFYAPVNPIAGFLNTVNGGRTVPLTFNVRVNGVGQTTTAGLDITQQWIACDSSAPEDDVEPAAATGDTALRYDAEAGHFVYNWQAPKTPGRCYMVRMTTTQDGLALTARFRVK